ncbi:MAG: L-seryl-tRNA(Sec) selenium transferase [Planctomycetaceae bacterium]|nr:L-seryl-tRNA(Sec) selenium transferase [Planctomycetaceae bacterium]
MQIDQSRLRLLPSVNDALNHTSVAILIDGYGRKQVLNWIREELEGLRVLLIASDSENLVDKAAALEALAEQVNGRAKLHESAKIGRIINATGVVLHTGLGRAPLSQQARSMLAECSGAGNIEIDLDTGERRYRGFQLTESLRSLTGAEDALVVNNNAAATLLTLQSLCAGREVIISRGQLIEIGGSFRLPEIFELSGAILREVGTTNRTKLSDYEAAIGENTAAIMHVHPSNYRVVGFSETPGIDQLAPLARERQVISIDDIGSGALVEMSQFGLPVEPTFQNSTECGADVILGSGDKLLGGPQCGIVVGNHQYIEQVRNHPLARAVRVGKLTLSALAGTLDPYLRDAAEKEVPTLQMLAATLDELTERAASIVTDFEASDDLTMTVKQETAFVGGGSLPAVEMPTAVIALTHSSLSPESLAHRLRIGTIRVYARIHQDQVMIDLRSVHAEDDSKIGLALRLLAK